MSASLYFELSFFYTDATYNSAHAIFNLDCIHRRKWHFFKNVIWNTKGKSLLSCSQFCARQEDCKSVNFQTDQGMCSLLRETVTENPDMLVELKSSLHLEKVGQFSTIC